MPKSDFPEKRRTKPYARVAYGYKPAVDDPLVLIPDEDMMAHITEALDFIDGGGSFREACTWLGQTTGKTIPQGPSG